MAGTRRNAPRVAYGLSQALPQLAPLPIVSRRAPTANDMAEIGTTWVDVPNQAVYVLADIGAGVATWTTSPASGVGVFASVTVNPGDITVTAGNVDITAGDLTVGGNTILTGDLTVSGVVTITGDIDFTSALLIDLTSTLNAAPSILLHANGGVAESIELHSDQGTSTTSINLHSDVGGITLTATGLASADAINIEALQGGIDMDSALLMSLTSTRNNAQAILLEATLGGIDILASGAAAGEDIDIIATGSSVNINSTENVADSIVISSTNGGIDILALGAAAGEDIDIVATGSSVNITSTEDVAQAIYIRANAGTSETVQIHADQGTGVASINILSDVGGLTLRATGLASADAINLEAAAGGIDADAALQINIASSQAAVDALRFVASNAAGGIDIDAGTGGITLDSTGAFSIDGAAASNVTVTGAGIDLTLSSVGGSVLVESTENAANAIRLHANGGVTETIQLHSDQGTAVNSIDLLSDVGGITLQAGLATADAINFASTNGGIDMDAALQINVRSTQNAADSIVIESTLGGIDILASGAGAGEDIDIVATGSSVNINSTENVADSIVISSTNGGIDILALGAAAGEDIDIVATGSSINLLTSEDAASAILLQANGGVTETIDIAVVQGTAADSISLDSTAGGITLSAGLATADAINLSAPAGGIDVDAALLLALTSTRNNAQAILMEATLGGIDILASGAAAGEDIDIVATGSSVNITATEAAADAIVLNASNAAGGIDLLTGGGEITISSSGNVTMAPGTATVASPAATAVINARVFVATFTGFTTAAGANEDFTITNSQLGVGDGIFVTVSNTGTNDADMTLEGVITQTAGSLVIHTQNNGSAALNGNVIITGWIIN